MIEKENQNEAASNSIEIDLEFPVESKEAEKITTPKKDTKKKQARILNF